MKKIAAIFSTAVLLSACGSPNMMPMGRGAMPPAQMRMNARPTVQVGAQSLLGINKELKRSVEANFAAKDADGDGFILPNEFPVESPEDFNHFRRLDGNRDGKIRLSEMSEGLLGRVSDVLQLKATAAFIFDELDIDNNKRLTKEEASASKVAGVASNYDAYLGKSWITGKPYNYLRKTDFENLLAFAMTNPNAAGGLSAEQFPEEVIAD